jgi:hypothetical protein
VLLGAAEGLGMPLAVTTGSVTAEGPGSGSWMASMVGPAPGG